MTTTASEQRIMALVAYFVAALLFLGFLAPLGDDGGLAVPVAYLYVPLSIYASVAAFRLPLSYCTVLKGVGLAGLGALLPTLIFCGPCFVTNVIRAP